MSFFLCWRTVLRKKFCFFTFGCYICRNLLLRSNWTAWISELVSHSMHSASIYGIQGILSRDPIQIFIFGRTYLFQL